MRKLKQISILTVLLSGIVLFTNCESDQTPQEENSSINYDELNNNITDYTKLIGNFLKDESTFTYLSNNQKDKINVFKKAYESKSSVEFKVDFPTSYSSQHSTFLLEFYNKIANSYDYDLLTVISQEEEKLIENQTSFTEDEYNQIYSAILASKQAVSMLENLYNQGELSKSAYFARGGGGFWDCMRKNAGKAIGRGLAGGFISGFITGGIVGATGGTVVVPLVGTVVGGVGAAVVTGTVTGIKGAVLGALWTAADCAPSAGGGKQTDVAETRIQEEAEELGIETDEYGEPLYLINPQTPVILYGGH